MGRDPKDQEEYISLAKAAEDSPYSQEYLSLRARQGKFKAIKLGRNWATKKEWVEEYIVRAQNYREELNHKIEKKELEQAILAQKAEEEPGAKISKAKLKISAISSMPQEQPSSRFALTVALAFLVLISSTAFSTGGFMGVFKDVEEVFSDVTQKSKIVFNSIGEEIKEGGAEVSLVLDHSLIPVQEAPEFDEQFSLTYSTTIWQETGHIFAAYFSWLREKLRDVFF